ncbi:MAG: TIGR04283 family arsenosugar biosynthesis glycosyltransferase [Gammaproteobacteria bacterium]
METAERVSDRSVENRFPPRLSIVVPCLNEEAVIVEALTALDPLRRRGTELILVDGGSSDETLALAGPWVDCVLTGLPGRARQMNTGAGEARGDILLFLHADTRLPQNADDLIAGALGGGRVWGRFDVAIEGRHAMLRVVARLMNLRSRLTGIATGDQAIFVSRRAFREIGGYPDLPLMEDIALSRRLKSLGRPACLYERVTTSGRRWETQGVWRTILLMWRLRFQYFLGADAGRLAARYEAGRWSRTS